MKIDRLIGIVTILLQTEKSTVPALAQRFEVSRRTIERDIDALCRAGVPLVTVQGYGGGVFIELLCQRRCRKMCGALPHRISVGRLVHVRLVSGRGRLAHVQA